MGMSDDKSRPPLKSGDIEVQFAALEICVKKAGDWDDTWASELADLKEIAMQGLAARPSLATLEEGISFDDWWNKQEYDLPFFYVCREAWQTALIEGKRRARLSPLAQKEVEVIDPYVMDLVRQHGSTMTNSEIVQKFLPKERLSHTEEAHLLPGLRCARLTILNAEDTPIQPYAIQIIDSIIAQVENGTAPRSTLGEKDK